MLPVEQPFKVYTGLDGKPLDNGYVYFGQPNQNPITAQVEVYWDAAGTIPAAQPLRTMNGYILRAGTPANVFFDGAYSELVQDSKKRQVFYARTSDEFSIAAVVGGLFKAAGSALVGFIQAGVGAIKRTIQDELRDTIKPQQFGAVAEGTTDDTAAFQKMLNATPANSYVRVKGKFRLAQNVYMTGVDNVTFDFSGAQITWESNNLLMFDTCNNIKLLGMKAGCTGAGTASINRPAGTAVPAAYWGFGIVAYNCNQFTVLDCDIDFNGTLLCIAGGDNHRVDDNVMRRGGDNTIYIFNTNNSSACGNHVLATKAGRAICFQRGNGNRANNNTVSGGFGIGVALVGSSNSTACDNTIRDIAYDGTVLFTSAGISLEGNEAGDTTTAALNAADADLFLLNSAYTRGCTVSGNAISNTGIGILAGIGPRGNYGVNTIGANTITKVSDAISLVDQRGPLTISANGLRACTAAGIRLSAPATGKAEKITVVGNGIDSTNTAGFGYSGIHKEANVTAPADIAIISNRYSSTSRSNIPVTQATYTLDWPESPTNSIITVGDAAVVAAEGQIAAASGVYQPLIDLTQYIGTLGIADVTFVMGQGDRNPVPMAKFTYSRASNTNTYQTKTVAGTEDVRLNNGVLEVLANNALLLGYGGAWRATVTCNRYA
jgi:parallel beta-helix repeat protein